MPVETEIKLSIPPASLPALRRHTLLAGVAPQRRKLHSVYYDTIDHQLSRAGIALRVRRVSGKWVLTLKTEGRRTAGLSIRPEWEAGLPGPYPDPAFLPAEARALLPKRARTQPLVPLYATVCWRTLWRLPGMEITLDQGEIQAANQTIPILELEIEAKQAATTDLFGVARQLAAALDLTPLAFSKAERGLILAGIQAAGPTRAAAVELNPAMMPSQAFCAIAGACLDQWQRNLSGLIQGADPEYLHQARVAVRRLRSAISLFNPVFSGGAAEFSARLRQLMATLGSARDLDVLLLETWADLSLDLSPILQSSLLQERLERARQAARARMVAEADATHTSLLMLDFGQWIAALDAPSSTTPEPALRDFSAAALARLHKRFSRRARQLRQASRSEQHAARIAGKKLRYAVEFLGSLYDKKDVRPYAAALTKIQDQLGTLNDAAVTMHLLDEIGQVQEIPHAAGLVAGHFAARQRAALEQSEQSARRFLNLAPFWKT